MHQEQEFLSNNNFPHANEILMAHVLYLKAQLFTRTKDRNRSQDRKNKILPTRYLRRAGMVWWRWSWRERHDRLDCIWHCAFSPTYMHAGVAWLSDSRPQSLLSVFFHSLPRSPLHHLARVSDLLSSARHNPTVPFPIVLSTVNCLFPPPLSPYYLTLVHICMIIGSL